MKRSMALIVLLQQQKSPALKVFIITATSWRSLKASFSYYECGKHDQSRHYYAAQMIGMNRTKCFLLLNSLTISNYSFLCMLINKRLNYFSFHFIFYVYLFVYFHPDSENYSSIRMNTKCLFLSSEAKYHFFFGISFDKIHSTHWAKNNWKP